MIFKDKFRVGQLVTWRNDHYATMTEGRERIGDGPFRIATIEDVTHHLFSVGHTQHVTLYGISTNGMPERFSGAFFKEAKP